MKRFAMSLVLATVWLSAEEAPSRQELRAILDELSGITGMPVRRDVPASMMSRPQLRKFLADQAESEIDPKELAAEEMTLKKFGLVPADFDLKKTMLGVLEEQAAAFYNFKKRRLFLMDARTGIADRVVMAHELSHALADQHYSLERFLSKVKTDDEELARAAVVEGQATVLMSHFDAGNREAQFPASSSLTRAGSSGFDELDKAPLYLRVVLLFPYWDGAHFQKAAIAKYGTEAYRRVFERPPVSTQQILHPERYFEGLAPEIPPLARIRAKGLKKLADGAVGELDVRTLLTQFDLESPVEIAEDWRGGRFVLYGRRSGGEPLLVYSSSWRDEAAARRFADAYASIIRKKDQPGLSHQTISGRNVLFVEGLRQGEQVVLPPGF